MFLMLASSSTNYLQKTSKIAQFSLTNAKKQRKTSKNQQNQTHFHPKSLLIIVVIP